MIVTGQNNIIQIYPKNSKPRAKTKMKRSFGDCLYLKEIKVDNNFEYHFLKNKLNIIVYGPV